TDPLRADTDGDGLSDYDEVFKTRTNSRLRDTDGDFIPDNFDILLPTTNDFTYIIVAVMLIGLLRLHSYGLFRNWRRDIIGVGLSDLGGIPMFVLPERFPVEIDISLISSGITGIFTMAGELSQRALNRIVLSGVVPILIDKGEYTLMWVFLRREYPRVIKQLSKLHREMEKVHGPTLAEWSGIAEELVDVKSWIIARLYPEARSKAKKELRTLGEDFREAFESEK
ncbi:MAG: thrombospondin type 3 repeat-containing protein, partial [Crenarchaeota archaeon]|nr:thrombospondin type 3 repeat-containing protein [Thermoproteota archaeon]